MKLVLRPKSGVPPTAAGTTISHPSALPSRQGQDLDSYHPTCEWLPSPTQFSPQIPLPL